MKSIKVPMLSSSSYSSLSSSFCVIKSVLSVIGLIVTRYLLVSIWIILYSPNLFLTIILGINLICPSVISSPSSIPNSLGDNNFPPRFISSGGGTGGGGSGSEIVIRVKEGPSSLGKEIYRLTGEDPDGDPLTFGVLGTIGEDILKIDNDKSSSSATIYLRKELDRETRDSYSLVLTLTDGKLGKGNYVSIGKVIFFSFSSYFPRDFYLFLFLFSFWNHILTITYLVSLCFTNVNCSNHNNLTSQLISHQLVTL